MYHNEPYRNAVKLQRAIMSCIDSGKATNRDLSQLSRAFCDLEETKRKLAMKPLPKAIDVSKHRRRESDVATYTDAPTPESPMSG